MTLTIKPVESQADRLNYVRIVWLINRGDPNWVPPLIDARLAKLDPRRNSFWKTTDQALWMVYRDRQPVGSITAMVDHHAIDTLGDSIGTFGFFECIHDFDCSRLLFDTAAAWLKEKGCIRMRGPYNPTISDESGILVEGFQTRPCLLMGHNPRYYEALFTDYGFLKYNDLLARHYKRPAEARSVEDALPEKILRVAEIASKRSDLRIRPINIKAWDQEIDLACRIYNRALFDLPDYVPITPSEFRQLADSFKQIIDPQFALIAEIGGEPVAFALAMPDINEALQHVNGKLDLLGLVKFWWYSRHLKRISFKILMLVPEYWNRGIETVLGLEIARHIWDGGYQEVDLSLTGEENIKSTRFQEHVGFQIYRRYRIFEKGL